MLIVIGLLLVAVAVGTLAGTPWALLVVGLALVGAGVYLFRASGGGAE